MTSGRTARMAAAAALVPLAVGLLAAAPSSTATAGGRPLATQARGVAPVLLSSIAPSSPSPGDVLLITGVVRNEGPVPITGVAVRLRVSPTAVRSRSEIDEILAGTAGRTGVAISDTRTAVADVLAPGSSARFRLSVPVSALGLPPGRNEVVVLGVESLGDVADDGQGVIQTGLTRTFLPWFPRPDLVVATPLVWLFPLTSAPARAADGAFLDDHLATEVGPQGRLTRLLDAAEQAPSALSWVVDPALLQSLQEMGAGYRVRHPDGTSAEGTGGPAAVAWLARLSALSANAEVTASAYGDPDVVALHRAGLDVDIALAATTARDLPDQVLAAPVGTGLAWPPGAQSDDGTLDVLRASGAREVVLSAASFPPSPPVTYTPTGSLDLSTGGSPLRAVLADPALSRLVAAPTATEVTADPVVATPVERRQQALAQIAMTTLELPTTPRTLVIAPAAQWATYGGETRDLVASVSTSNFVRPERLGVLAALPASDVPRARVDYPPSARAAELPQRFLAQVGQQRHDLAALRSVAPDLAASRSLSSDALEQALTRSESAAWRTEPAHRTSAARVGDGLDHRAGVPRAGPVAGARDAARRRGHHPGDGRQRPGPPGARRSPALGDARRPVRRGRHPAGHARARAEGDPRGRRPRHRHRSGAGRHLPAHARGTAVRHAGHHRGALGRLRTRRAVGRGRPLRCPRPPARRQLRPSAEVDDGRCRSCVRRPGGRW